MVSKLPIIRKQTVHKRAKSRIKKFEYWPEQVVRGHPKLAFDVNCRGVWNAVRAAVEAGTGSSVSIKPIKFMHFAR